MPATLLPVSGNALLPLPGMLGVGSGLEPGVALGCVVGGIGFVPGMVVGVAAAPNTPTRYSVPVKKPPPLMYHKAPSGLVSRSMFEKISGTTFMVVSAVRS